MSKRKSTDLFKADKRRVSKSCSKTTGYIQGHVKGSSSETRLISLFIFISLYSPKFTQ